MHGRFFAFFRLSFGFWGFVMASKNIYWFLLQERIVLYLPVMLMACYRAENIKNLVNVLNPPEFAVYSNNSFYSFGSLVTNHF